jgi:arylsulfatase A-like enzyme
MNKARRYVKLGVIMSIGLISGCERLETVEMPLVDSNHRPMILTERRALALPNALPGTRFVRGWRFTECGSGLRIRPDGSTASLEIVLLDSRERDLVLELAEGWGGGGGSVRVRAAERELGSFEIAEDVVIRLPAGLGPGRVPIELEFSSVIELAGATLSSVAPRGRLEIVGTDVIHSGWPTVDFIRWVDGGGRLAGELLPPAGVSPQQRFTIAVGRGDDRAETVFETEYSSSTRTEGGLHFDVPLLDAAGLVRIRLTAEGRGNPGTWRDLQLIVPRTTAARTPVKAPDSPKLVVLYAFDALRADHMGYLGSTLGASPCIDRLASEGAAFANHFSVAPNTGPATKLLFTGWGFLKGRQLAAEGPATLAEIFADAGFVTASISSNFHVSPGLGLTRGFEHVELLPLQHDKRDGVEATINDSAERIHAAALRWLDGLKTDESVFLYLHSLNPHNPYNPPTQYQRRFVGDDLSLVNGQTETLLAIRDLELAVTPEDERRIRQMYAANLSYNDFELCGFVKELERRYPGDVMLALTSDHGEELFDHDGVLHGHTLYDEMLHVPLVVWWPGQVSQSVIDEPTDTLDLHATLRSLVAPLPQKPEDGDDLWGSMMQFSEPAGEPRLQFATAPGLRWAAMARSERWKLILVPRPRLTWGMGRGRGRTHEAEYLFHLESDPGERSNLAGISSLEADWLWSRLQAWQATWRARQPQAVGVEVIDETTKRELEALGYTE